MTQPSVPLTRPVEPIEPTHACIRCGRPGVAAELALCERCNPLELAQPSATQVHGIAALGIVAFVVVLAVFGRLAISGTGPFAGTVDGAVATDGGLAVTLNVSNDGSKAGATTCRLVLDTRPTAGPSELIQTPSVPAGSSVRFTTVVTTFGTTPVGLAVDCQSP